MSICKNTDFSILKSIDRVQNQSWTRGNEDTGDFSTVTKLLFPYLGPVEGSVAGVEHPRPAALVERLLQLRLSGVPRCDLAEEA